MYTYTKYIVAIVMILVVVVFVNSVDRYADVDSGLMLSSFFRKPSRNKQSPDSKKKEGPAWDQFRNRGKTGKEMVKNHVDTTRQTGDLKAQLVNKDGTCPAKHFASHEVNNNLYCMACPPSDSALAYILQNDDHNACGKYKETEPTQDKAVKTTEKSPATGGSYKGSTAKIVKKSNERKTCDKYATKNQKMFKPCKNVDGKRRYGCIGKHMETCMLDQIYQRNKKDKKNSAMDKERSATVYAKANFGGSQPLKLTGFENRPRLSEISWNNKISSAIVADGYELELYNHSKYRGKMARLKPGHYKNLGDFDGKASSLVVTKA